jgi:dTDP-4-dehydrorhamnose reductase
MMKILITGANGLLGQHLVQHLLQSGHQVIATSRGPSRLPEFNAGKNLQYKSIDITNDFELWDYFSEAGGVDTLVHAAALTQVDACEQDQDACFDCNFEGTTHALVSAEEYCKHFIYVSTDFVSMESRKLPRRG